MGWDLSWAYKSKFLFLFYHFIYLRTTGFLHAYIG